GIGDTRKWLTPHTIDWQHLERFSDTPERWLDLSWNGSRNGSETHVGHLHVVIANEPGSLGALTTTVGRNEGNITNLKITNRATDFFEMSMDVEVKDLRHLTNIIAALRATPSVNSVERARG